MKKRTLALALVASLSCNAYATASLPAADEENALHFLRLTDLPKAMATTQRNPAHWRTPDALRGLAYRDAAKGRDPVVAWVAGEALGEPATRSLVSKAFRQGMSVLVTSQDGAVRHEAEVFGIEGEGRTSLYRRGADGVIEVSTLDDVAADVETSQRLYRELAASAAPRFAAFRSAALADAPSDDIPDHVPHERFRHSAVSSNGNRVAHDIVVLRDARTSSDSKVIIVKAIVDIAPWDTGVSEHNRDGYRRDGTGDFVKVAGRYELKTLVDWEGKERGPDLRLERMIPSSSPDVNRSVARSSEVSTSYGVSTSSNAEDALKGMSISAIGKVPFEFSANRTYSDSTSVSMETQSYYIDAASEDYGRTQGVTWNLHLANDIAGNPKYFNSSADRYKVSTAAVTPMMRKASAQLMSVWRVRGDYEGNLVIGTGGRVENRQYGYNYSAGISWDRSSDVHPEYTADVPWWFWHKDSDPWGHLRQVPAQPSQVVKINLGSPYLTSSPTVLLQSSSGEGLCIGQSGFGDKSGTTALVECDKAEGNLAQQWNMDSEGRYLNRLSAQCLQIDTGTGTVGTATCGFRHNQRWRWAADRIMSMMDGGTMHRLEVRDDSLVARFDETRHDEVVVNTENALLPPWSNYPLAPSRGSTIPRLATNSPTVPESYLSYRRVAAAERWETIPLSR